MISSGKQKHKVYIQQKTATATGFSSSGGESWTNITSNPIMWVNIRGLNGRELAQLGTEISRQMFVVDNMRYRSDVTNKNALLWGSRTLEVRSVKPDPNFEWVELLVEEVK